MKLSFSSGLSRWFYLTGLMILLGLTACHRQTSRSFNPNPENLPCKVYGSTDQAIIAMQEAFNKKGIKVVTIGQNYLMSIPSCDLFANQSPRLHWESYALLNEVACYLKQFRQTSITITAFSNKYISYRREQALTLARSRRVGRYLWSQGVDSRFIFTQGLGSDKPIMSYRGGGDASPNSRVEITFRRAVA